MAAIENLAVARQVDKNFGQVANAFVQKAAPDPVNGNLIEVGDSKQPQAFFPQVKLTRWGNECNFSMRLVEWDDSPATVETAGNVVKYRKPSYEAQWFDLGFEDETGGHEHLVVLNQPPPTNQIQWTVRSKGLDFFPQSALTPEEVIEGCFRPDDIVDSLAVYHKIGRNDLTNAKRLTVVDADYANLVAKNPDYAKWRAQAAGKNYKNGKAFHLKRIIATDAAGAKVYGKQDIQITNAAGDGVYIVTLPQEFLDAAVYPVTVDPTIGYTTHGATGLSLGTTGNALVSLSGQYAASAGDTLTGYTIFARGVGGNTVATLAAYTVTGGNPSARVAAGVDITGITSGTATEYSIGSLSQALSGSTTYCVAVTASNATNSLSLRYDSGTPGNLATTSTTLDDPCPYTGVDGGRMISFWATVTAGGGGTTINADQAIPAALRGTLAAAAGLAAGWRQAVDADQSPAASYRQALAGAGMLPAAWRTSIQSDQSLPIALIAQLAVDAALPAASRTSISSDQAAPTGLRAVVDADAEIPAGWLGAVSVDADAALPAAWRALLDADQSLPAQWRGAVLVNADAALPAAWRAAMASDQAAPVRISAQLRLDNALPVGWMSHVHADVAAPAGWRVMVAADQAASAAWRATVTADQRVPAVWLQPAPSFVDGVTEVWYVDARGVVWEVPARDVTWIVER